MIDVSFCFDPVCIPPPADWQPETEAAALPAKDAEPKADAGAAGSPLAAREDGAEGASDQQAAGPSPTRVLVAEVPAVSEVDARNALLSMVTEHCCWGKAAARNMAINKIASTSAFHVIIKFIFLIKKENH